MKTLNNYLLPLFLFFIQFTHSQSFKEYNTSIPVAKDSIYGTLLIPETVEKPALVILIPGSGPTDRNGNQGMLKTNSLKYVAESLSDRGFATYRFDQSVISQVKLPDFKEENYTFTPLVDEVKSVVLYFKNSGNYTKIILAGHSQGSLVGMLAIDPNVNAFISLNGAGQSIDKIIYQQLNKQVPMLESSFSKTLAQLKNGEKATDVSPVLMSVFRPSVQPFLIDWMQYDPAFILEKVTIPVLIIGGTKDIQVAVEEAERLHHACSGSQLKIVENMNHIFKEIKGSEAENQLSYMNPDLPVMPELMEELIRFLNSI